MAPLEARLEPPPNAPISVAQMIVDRRVVGFELDRMLEIIDRRLIIAEPVIGPAQAVNDKAVIRALLDRSIDQRQRLFQLLATVDPRIAEIIENLAAGLAEASAPAATAAPLDPICRCARARSPWRR